MMSVFNSIGSSSIFSSLGSGSSSSGSSNEVELSNVPSDTISRVKFSPSSLSECYLLGSSWSGDVCVWQVDANNGTSLHKAQKNHGAPVLDCCWSDDGQFVFTAGTDNIVRGWSLAEDKYIQVGSHDAPVKTVNFIKRPTYSCIMTGSWDKTVRFWDLRSPTPAWNINLGERVYCADAQGPMAVAMTADRFARVFQLDPSPSEYSEQERRPIRGEGNVWESDLRCRRGLFHPVGFNRDLSNLANMSPFGSEQM